MTVNSTFRAEMPDMEVFGTASMSCAGWEAAVLDALARDAEAAYRAGLTRPVRREERERRRRGD